MTVSSLENVFTSLLYALYSFYNHTLQQVHFNTIYCEIEGNYIKKKNSLTTGKGELMPPQCSVNFISYLSLEISQMCNVHLAIKLPTRQLLSIQQRTSVSHVWWHGSFGGGRWWWVLGTAGRLQNASHQDHWALKDNALSETV